MRKTLLLLSLFIATNAIGQSLDCQRLSSRDIDGTARYVGMAGAMTAIGGDPSAVLDNPAGLGVYRHWEVMMSLSVRPEVNLPLNKSVKWTHTLFDATQVSGVFSFVDPYADYGVVANNIMIGFHKVKTFNSRYQIRGKSQGPEHSLTGLAALQASGRGITEFMLANEGDVVTIPPTPIWYENEDISWLSGMMYHTYLINPDAEGGDTYSSLLRTDEPFSTDITVVESGSHNSFNFSYGMNVSNRFYWGLGLNIDWLNYRKETTYKETFGAENFTIQSILQQKGIGVNGTVGVLYRPVQAFRVGASFQTPTAMSLDLLSDGQIKSNIEMQDETGDNRQIVTFSKPTPYAVRYTDRKFTAPLRFSVSPAVQIGEYGLISFQYDLSHWKNTFDVHTFKVGVEGAICGSFLIEAGYAYESTFLKDKPIYSQPVNTVRLDTDWKNIYHSQYASIGFGYHGEWAIAHIAYQCRWYNSDVYAHELAIPEPMRTMTHNIVFTLAWHSR